MCGVIWGYSGGGRDEQVKEGCRNEYNSERMGK